MTWFVYILECSDGSYYTGITNNLEKRLRQHNGEIKGGARYTRSRRPVKLAISMERNDRASAARTEATIKRLDHDGKAELIRRCNIELADRKEA